MKKPAILSVFFLLLLGCLTPLQAQDQDKVKTEKIQNEVDEIFKEMVVFAEKLDFDRLSAGVDDNRKAGFITNNKYYSDYATLIDAVKANARGIDKQEITIGEKKITVLSDQLVLLTASGVAKAFIEDGREIAADFHWSFVYEKKFNAWKVIYSHQSTVQ